jgi:hypothetical protein
MNDPPVPSNNESRASTATVPADSHSVVSEDEMSKKEFDPRLYRPLDVIVSITMHDIQAHLMKVGVGYVLQIFLSSIDCGIDGFVVSHTELRGEGSTVPDYSAGKVRFRNENRVQRDAVAVVTFASNSRQHGQAHE